MNAAVMDTTQAQAEAIIGIVRFAVSAGLPLQPTQVVAVGGSDEEAAVIFARTEELLTNGGVSFTRESNDLRQALVIQAGAGVTYRLIRWRRAAGSGPGTDGGTSGPARLTAGQHVRFNAPGPAQETAEAAR